MTEWILEMEIAAILFLQGLGGWLVIPMGIFTFLGHHTFYLLLLATLLWCVNAKVGLRVGLLLTFSGGINYLFKISFAGPRPYWYDSRVLALSTEPTFGVPSGHAQQAVLLWGLLARASRLSWAWGAALFMMFLIGISRLYLGVHFLHDVLLGWLIGLVLLLTSLSLEKRLAPWFFRLTAVRQVLLAFAVSLLLMAAAVGIRWVMSDWTLPDSWQVAAAQAAPDSRPLDPLSFAGLVSAAGGFFGLSAGAIWIARRGGFSAAGTLTQRLLRLPLGAVGAGILYAGLGSLLPQAGWIAPLLQYLLYAILGFCATGLAPLLFQRLGLARAPAPLRN
jgi:membrane-associated phospholipid phosphatase